MQQGDPIQLKEESLRWLLSITGALLVFYVVAAIAAHVYQPNIDGLITTANQLLAEPNVARPEPMEALLFRLGVFSIIPALAAFYRLFTKSRLVSKLVNKPVYLLLSVVTTLLAVALVYSDFAAFNPYGPAGGDNAQNKRDIVGPSNFDYYFDGLFLGNYLWVYLLLLLPAVAALFLIGFRKHKWDDNKRFNTIVSVAGYTIGGCTLAAIIAMHTFAFPYSNDNKFDFSAVYYAMTQVFAGTPMLVNGFTSTYGLYPQLLNPLFQLTGLSILNFSLVMSALLGASFLCNFYFLKQFVSNKVILFLGFFIVLFYPYLDFKITIDFDCVFSFYPIRYIIPSGIACLAGLYLHRPSAKLYWATSLLAGIFILWNPEMGLICYVAWIAVNMYKDMYEPKGRLAVKKILFHPLVGSVLGVVVFYCYKLVVWGVYGTAPDMQLLFSTIFVFGKLGFNLLPMPLVHPWNITAVIIICGFVYAIAKAYRKDITPKSAAVFLTTIIALGCLVYYQGRSQNANFATSSGFSIILLILLGDELWKTAKNTNILLFDALFVIFLSVISFSLPELLYNTDKIMTLVYQEEDKTSQYAKQETIERNNEFVLQHSGEQEKILMLVQKKNQALFFDGHKRISAFNPGFIDLFLKEDVTRLEQVIRDSSFNTFIEPSTRTYPYMARPTAALAATYEYKAVNKTMVMLVKRKTSIPAGAFFTDTIKPLLHRKYNDDKEGLAMRIDDAAGIAPVATGSQFSVQLLFYSLPQMFTDATLAGNIKDSTGFGIVNVFNSSQFLCVVNGMAFNFDMPYNKWVYLAANVFADHLDIYRNGQLVRTGRLSYPVRTSAKNFTIGNMGNPGEFNYYVGAIAEVSIANTILDTGKINATWQQVSASVGK